MGSLSIGGSVGRLRNRGNTVVGDGLRGGVNANDVGGCSNCGEESDRGGGVSKVADIGNAGNGPDERDGMDGGVGEDVNGEDGAVNESEMGERR